MTETNPTAFWRARDVLSITGEDAVTYLQGQLSQDVEALAPGTSADTLILQPQGKIDAWFRIHRSDDPDGPLFIADVAAGWAEPLIARLERFKLRVKVDINIRRDWGCLALRGSGIDSADPVVGAVVRVPVQWPGHHGVDLLGPRDELVIPAGFTEVEADVADRARIEAGIPEMGTELTESTIPAAAGIVERSVSFTKGCYTGQELVARIDSRGNNTPKHLRHIAFAADDAPAPGAGLVLDGKSVGELTSVAPAVGQSPGIALAYVHRSVEPATVVEITGSGASIAGEVKALPKAP